MIEADTESKILEPSSVIESKYMVCFDKTIMELKLCSCYLFLLTVIKAD